MSQRPIGLVALVAILFASTGCESFDHVPWRLDRTRVLALRVEVAGESERSIPAPGERARVRALVVDPGADRTSERAWRFEACVAAADTRAGISCAAPPFSEHEGSGAVDFELEVPDAPGRILLTGIVCTGGAPIDEGAGLDCRSPGGSAGGSEAQAGDFEEVTLSILVSGEHVNRHPDLTTEPTLGGEPWPEGAGCADVATLRWAASRGEGQVAWDLGPDAREALEGGLEELLVSHVTTHGELDRYRSLIEPDELPAALEVAYRPPAATDIPPEGLDVSFVLVVRDERGGVAWIRRSLCVTP